MTLHLVACAASKGPAPAPARHLYISDWFTKARAYVEAQGTPWRILSARYGLLDPDKVIEPYDLTLANMTRLQRMAWGETAAIELGRLVPRFGEVVILAGRLYRESLLDNPPARFSQWRVAVPMEGLGIGQQKAWLASQRLAA